MLNFIKKDILPVKEELNSSDEAAFDHNYASRLDGDNVKGYGRTGCVKISAISKLKIIATVS